MNSSEEHQKRHNAGFLNSNFTDVQCSIVQPPNRNLGTNVLQLCVSSPYSASVSSIMSQ